MGAVEADAPTGETIDVGRLDDRMAVGAKIGVEVVDDDEKDVPRRWSLPVGLWSRGGARERGEGKDGQPAEAMHHG